MVMKAVEATSASDAVAKLSAAAAKMGIKCSVPSSFAPARHKCDYDYYFYGALKKKHARRSIFLFFLSWHFFKGRSIYTAHLKAIVLTLFENLS